MKGRLSNQPPLSHMRTSLVRALAALGATVAASTMPAAQAPTFRGGVDLIAVDVEVVDRIGTPVVDLASGKFSVSIDGHERRIVSVDQVKYSSVGIAAAPMTAIAMAPSARNDWVSTGPVTRTFLLAFDVGSFGMAESRRAAEAARAFVDRLLPNDVVGLYSYPFGPRIVPTADRQAIRSALGTVMGGAKSMIEPVSSDAGGSHRYQCGNRRHWPGAEFRAHRASAGRCGRRRADRHATPRAPARMRK